MSDVSELKAEVARLKAKMDRIAPDPEPEAPRPDWVPPTAFKDNCGMWRDGRGKVLQGPDARTHEDYIADLQRRIGDDAKAQKRYRSHDSDGEPLPDGFFRDPHGMIRSRDGRLAQVVEREETAVREIRQQQAEEHRQFLGQTLPSRNRSQKEA